MDFHPRPWGVVRKSSPSCPRHLRPHGRGAAVSARCASRDSRAIQRIGRDAGNGVAQTERGGFRSSSLGGKSAPLPEHRFATRYRSGDMRSVSRLWRASRQAAIQVHHRYSRHPTTPQRQHSHQPPQIQPPCLRPSASTQGTATVGNANTNPTTTQPLFTQKQGAEELPPRLAGCRERCHGSSGRTLNGNGNTRSSSICASFRAAESAAFRPRSPLSLL